MNAQPLSIWTNQSLPSDALQTLERGIAPHRLIVSPKLGGNLSTPGPDDSLAGADIAFGQPDPHQVIQLQSLKWIALTTAGYTRLDRADVRDALRRRQAQLTNSSSVFAEPCAQHLLAMILAFARLLPQCMENQLRDRAWPQRNLRDSAQLLGGQTVLIFGYGAIARRLVQLLSPLNLKLIALRRHVQGDELIDVRPITAADDLIPTADHLINILPASPQTQAFFTAQRLTAMKPTAFFYNIGRGTTVDQPALQAALTTGKLAAAYLDVFEPEPLPPDHPLWATRNCYLTPHIAGGFSTEFTALISHFLANFKRHLAGEPLTDRVF